MCSAVLAFIDYKQTNKQTNRHPNKVLSLDIKWQKKKKFQTIIRGTLSERVEKAWKYIPMLQTCVKSGIGTGSLIFDPLVVSDTGWFLLGPGTRLLLPTEEGPATEKKKHSYTYIYIYILRLAISVCLFDQNNSWIPGPIADPDPDPGSQYLADPTDLDPKHWFELSRPGY